MVLSLMLLFSVVFPAGVFADDEEFLDEETFASWEEEVVEDEGLIVEEEDASYEAPAAEEEELVVEESEDDTAISESEEEAEEEIMSRTALAITSHPKSVTVPAGSTAEFSVTATGTGLTYQWQYSKNGTTWTKTTSLTGYNTATLSVPVKSSYNGLMFRCAVTSNGTTKYSDGALLSKSPVFVVDGVTYEIIEDNNLKVVSYEGTDAAVVIPETVEGMTVTEIGEEAFMGNTTLESIDLPDTITIIRARAFKGCTKLSSMS
jgi:hypothetical protein